LSVAPAGARPRGRSGRSAKGPVPLGEALRRLTGSLGIATKLTEYQILAEWGEIVGERIAHVTTAERIERGILYVAVRSAPWRNELTMRRLEILDLLHRAGGRKVVKEIRFR
jgi:predicted nucleic acid-binding Zn ribbon protein